MNILLIHEHTLMHEGMQHTLNEISTDYVLFQAQTIQLALLILDKVQIEIVISEINISGTSAINMIATLKACREDLSILFYSKFSERLYALPLLRAGADGFLSSQSEVSELIKAITSISTGRKYLNVEFLYALIQQVDIPRSNTRDKGKYLESIENLSNRERSVMVALMQGKTTKEVSHELKLKNNTISTYKRRIYRKMNVNDQHELKSKFAIFNHDHLRQKFI